jgi:hypothetical protein
VRLARVSGMARSSGGRASASSSSARSIMSGLWAASAMRNRSCARVRFFGCSSAGGVQQLDAEGEVAAVARLDQGEVAGDGGDGPRVVEDLELGLEVADQREHVALGERDGLDRAQDREVAGRGLEGGLVALQGGAERSRKWASTSWPRSR